MPAKMDLKESELNLRPMYCELGALTRADGSALLTQGNRYFLIFVYIYKKARIMNKN